MSTKTSEDSLTLFFGRLTVFAKRHPVIPDAIICKWDGGRYFSLENFINSGSPLKVKLDVFEEILNGEKI